VTKGGTVMTPWEKSHEVPGSSECAYAKKKEGGGLWIRAGGGAWSVSRSARKACGWWRGGFVNRGN